MVARAVSRSWRSLLGVIVCFVGLGLAFSAVADADPIDCPTGSLDSSSLGQPEFELRELRNDLRGLCAALAERLDRDHVDAVALHDSLDDLLAAEDSPRAVNVVAPDPLSVRDSAALQYSDDVVSAVDASGTASTGALWYIAGLVVACFAGYAIYKQVMPRA